MQLARCSVWTSASRREASRHGARLRYPRGVRAGERLRQGEVSAGRYRIIRPIGAGGMGAVYEAEQLTLGRSVALKVLFDDDDRALARFEQEARALARISHPNVVGVIEFHRGDADRALLVMELLEGESLATALRR